MSDQEIQDRAIIFAKQNKIRIAEELTDLKLFTPDRIPISAFMAGSPGAGKTEFSKQLIEEVIEKDTKHRVVRIDADEIRPMLPGYNGTNSSLFQFAASIVVDAMHDLVLKHGQSFVLDATFADYDRAVKNIERSLKRHRRVLVTYVYQQPDLAWAFTQAREEAEGRKISKPVFIQHFLGAREVIRKVQQEYGDKILLFFVKKNFKHNGVEYVVHMPRNGVSIDELVPEQYSKEDLEKLL